jgi:uncharacterized delta-60 repeat protein
METSKRTFVLSYLTPLLIAALSTAAYAQPGQLDSSFGTGGMVQLAGASGVAKIVEQSNDGILVATPTAEIFQLESNGALNTGFGTQGSVTFTDAGDAVGVNDMQIQSDGKILLLGEVTIANCTNCRPVTFQHHGVVARFNTNGTLDTSFGTGGQVALTPLGSTTSEDLPSALLVQSDGKILIADALPPAAGSGSTSSVVSVLRFTASGTADATFGTHGAATAPGVDQAFALALEGSGKILAYGAKIVRLLPNGTVDTSTTPGTVVASTGSPAAIQPNEDYVISLAQTSLASFQVSRFTFPNEASDGTFSMPQISYDGEAADTFSQCSLVALQPSGDIIAAGRLEVQTGERTFDTSIGLARILSDGDLDTSFGTNGVVTTSFGGTSGDATAMTVQSDSNILVGGPTSNSGGAVVAVLRYLSN